LTGNDKEAANNNSNLGRRNGCHILNESTVDNLICIATLFEQIFKRNGISHTDGVGNIELEEKMVS